MSMVKLMRGKPVTTRRDEPHRVGSLEWSGRFQTWVVREERLPCTCSFEKYGRVFGIGQLDVHRLQSPSSSEMDTTSHCLASL